MVHLQNEVSKDRGFADAVEMTHGGRDAERTKVTSSGYSNCYPKLLSQTATFSAIPSGRRGSTD